MTVDRLRVEMAAEEFTHWCIYFARQAQRRELEAQRRR